MPAIDDTLNEPVLRVTDEARRFVVATRAEEPNAGELALFLEVGGVTDGAYSYDMWFEPLSDADPKDAITHHDDMSVVVTHSSIDKIRGATLDISESDDGPGLIILNPNTPPVAQASKAPLTGDLTSDIARQVIAVLEEQVNPQIASHGGRADLVAVDEGVAYLKMSGGCQGCGLAAVTLSQGIAVAIKDAVPEITDIVDVTSHADGSNPYYQPAKK